MTILTSVTACTVWCVSDALAILPAIRSAKCLVWFWTPPLQVGQDMPCPGQRCDLKARRLSEFRILPYPTISVRLLYSPPQGTFLSRSSLKIIPVAPPSTHYPRHVRDSNGANLLGLCAAVPIYIAATPTTFYQRSHVLQVGAPDWGLESNSDVLRNLRRIRLDLHFQIYK